MKMDIEHLNLMCAGRFVDRVDTLLHAGIAFEGVKLTVENVERDGNPFIQQMTVTFRVAALSQTPEKSSGPKFVFTFSSDLSVEENVQDLKEFVIGQMKLAGVPPIVEEIPVQAHHNAGD